MPECIRCGKNFVVKNDESILSKSLCSKCIEFESLNNKVICKFCGEVFEQEETMYGICFDCRAMNFIDYEEADILLMPYEEDTFDDENY